MKDLHWQKIGICKEDEEYVIFTASSFQSAVNVEGVTIVEADVTPELKLRVWMLDEMGAFRPLDKCLVVMVADALVPYITADPEFKTSLEVRQLL